jgi:predicted amidohydrolase YtcJ
MPLIVLNMSSAFPKYLLIALLATYSCLSLANDKIIVNATVWTGNPQQPWGETIAIKDNRILAVGGAELVKQYPKAELIDVKGKLVLPGFIDNHTHFMDGSASIVGIETQSAKSIEAFVNTIKAYSKTLEKGEWITGGIWDHEAWGGELPKSQWIDEFTQDTPLFLIRTDGHMGIANSRALQLAGINKDTVDPVGGLIVRDKDGNPSGVLKDNAMTLVLNVIPAATEERIDMTFDAGVSEALRNGVTQVHNMSDWKNIEIFERAKKDGRLKIRTYYIPYISHRHQLAARIKKQGKGDNWLRFGGVKELVDGSLGSTTAWFYEPYSDQPETNGFSLMSMADLKVSLQEAHDYGLQLAIHGIGDQANDELLNLFEEIGVKGHRARIEHAQHLSDDAIDRFKELDVLASMHQLTMGVGLKRELVKIDSMVPTLLSLYLMRGQRSVSVPIGPWHL